MSGRKNYVPIKDSEFKYTIDENRRRWVKNAFPSAPYLFYLIQTVPWSSFVYNKTIAWTHLLPEGGSAVSVPARIVTNESEYPPYFFFGGCVYEIMNLQFPSVNLREYVDPTGDIDVAISLPNITVTYTDEKIMNSPPSYLFYSHADGTLRMNDLLESYTTWLFNSISERLIEFSETPLFSKLFSETEYFDYTKDLEAHHPENKAIRINKLWFVRIIDIKRNMLKLQLIVKFKDVAKEDHIIEFVMPIKTTPSLSAINQMYATHARNICMVNTIPIQSPAILLLDNRESLERRMHLRSHINQHKFYNHVARLQYLNIFLPLHLNWLLERCYESDINITLKELFNIICLVFTARAKNELCLYDYTYKEDTPCTDATIYKIIRTMIGNVRSFFINDRLPARFAIKKISSILYGIINGERVPYETVIKLLPAPIESMDGGVRTRRTRRHKRRSIKGKPSKRN